MLNTSYEESLTPQQQAVLKLVCEGLSSKEIGEKLKISFRTVEAHKAGMMNKLNIHSLALLVRYAIRQGLVEA